MNTRIVYIRRSDLGYIMEMYSNADSFLSVDRFVVIHKNGFVLVFRFQKY